ncbi:MAG TPA: Rrf2 family transcriptional regulator, partial [Planctomycetota bacterium]|nr:Rrf2 family transcriptional regulator [Planctomycetota bacterium]
CRVLRLSRRSEYGIIAVTHLAMRRGEAVSVREIAERYGIPRRLLAEVMKDLVHQGLVRSVRGAAGGYRLATDPKSTSVRDVLAALEGPFELALCTGDPSRHLDGTCELLSCCPIRGSVHRIHERIHDVLAGVTLAEIVAPAPTPISLAPELVPAAPTSAAAPTPSSRC